MRLTRSFLAFCFLLFFNCLVSAAATTTTLTVTAGGSAVTSVDSGTVVTLTARVNAGAITTGLVNFCDATATYCTDVHILGSAQLTSAGTAVLKLIPGIGSHSYKAAFVGTNSNPAGTSTTSTLTVTGPYPTAITLTALGEQGNYSLTASLAGAGSITALTGSLSFLDTTSNTTLATKPVGSSISGPELTAEPIPVALDQGSYQAIATGDFNGDGKPDIALLNANGTNAPATNNTVSILLGNGDGTFTAGATPSTGSGPQTILVADLNGDGKLDLVTANSDQTLSVLLGNGDGTFAAATSVPFAGGPSLAVGDFNSDGKPDLIGASQTDLIVLLCRGDGTFTTITQASGQPSGLIAVGDFNGDGNADVALASGFPATDSQPQSGVVTVFFGKGDGTFSGVDYQTSTMGAPTAIAAADLNLDGKADLIVESFGTPANLDPMGQLVSGVIVLLSNGDGTFSVSSSGLPTPAAAIVVADFNRDGKPDVALADLSTNDPFQPSVSDPGSIQYGIGDGTFTAGPASTDVGAAGVFGGSSEVLTTADFNGDSFPDLAAIYSYNDGSFAAAELYQVTETATVTVTGIAPTGTGTHLVDVSYPGDANYLPSTSATVPLIAGTPVLTITPLVLPSGTVSLPYNQTLTAQGGTAPYQFAVTAGLLPAGLSLSSAGVLSGAPSGNGTYLFTITATDSKAGTPNSTSISYSMQIAPELIISFTGSLPDGTVGVPYSQTISAYGGTPPYTFSATGLPAGLTINSSGIISGTPTAVGTSSFFVSIEDSTPGVPLSGGSTYTLTIDAGSFTLTTPTSSSTLVAGQAATFTFTVTPLGNFNSLVTFTCGSNLPSGTSCSFAPMSVTPSGGPVTSVLTINTTAASTSRNMLPARPSAFDHFGTRFGSMSLAAILLVYVPRRFQKGRPRSKGRMLFLLAGMIASSLLWGCGGGGSTSITNPGTKAGTYSIDVTATQSGVANPMSQTTTVTLFVE